MGLWGTAGTADPVPGPQHGLRSLCQAGGRLVGQRRTPDLELSGPDVRREGTCYTRQLPLLRQQRKDNHSTGICRSLGPRAWLILALPPGAGSAPPQGRTSGAQWDGSGRIVGRARSAPLRLLGIRKAFLGDCAPLPHALRFSLRGSRAPPDPPTGRVSGICTLAIRKVAAFPVGMGGRFHLGVGGCLRLESWPNTHSPAIPHEDPCSPHLGRISTFSREAARLG